VRTAPSQHFTRRVANDNDAYRAPDLATLMCVHQLAVGAAICPRCARPVRRCRGKNNIAQPMGNNSSPRWATPLWGKTNCDCPESRQSRCIAAKWRPRRSALRQVTVGE
jgi:hypothetical protein